MGDVNKKSCFVISPIGDDGTETRKRSDQVLKHIIEPAAKDCGYEAIRADKIDKPGLITSQVIGHILNDDLVIADLTERNPNVFYELALRHAINKPLVQIIQKGDQIPFDVANLRTIYIDHTDLDSAAQGREEIVQQIRALQENPEDVETPIGVTLDLQALRQSENPGDREVAELIEDIAEIKASLSALKSSSDGSQLTAVQNRLEHLIYELDASAPVGRRGGLQNRNLRKTLDFVRHGGGRDGSNISLAILASVFRRSHPWLYEVGMEAYRQSTYGPKTKRDKALHEFRSALHVTLDLGPFNGDKLERESLYLVEEAFRNLEFIEHELR
ncbi:hypothetical protein Mmar10_0570 [Maricaulis maris MCS10]|uniref:Uncharacterized protein n=1 Tax=Maricaulis maris (strain MCS10) TaxID=394221 RepID=Q0AS74_MARMM|nr:hypothetical protein [Maricaulis maris]ABI64863.1 hypothetical protein Mmar10_0570 [Maricaulis maris MCS10]